MGVTNSTCGAPAYTGAPSSKHQRRRRRHRVDTMRATNGSASHVERRRDDAIDSQHFEREHATDHVDDGVHGAHFVQVHLFEAVSMNRSFGCAEPMEQMLRAVLAGRAQRRSVDESIDLEQTAMRMGMRVRRCVAVRMRRARAV